MTNTTTIRQELIDGLRAAADFLDQHPDIPVADDITVDVSSVIPYGDWDQEARVAQVARAMSPCTKDYSPSLLYLRRQFGPVTVEAFTGRSSVCERRVVGTRVVEREVVVTPAVTTTETVEEEIVEWECKPLLAPAAVDKAAAVAVDEPF